MRKANIKMYDFDAGLLIENEDGYHFSYYKTYLELPDSEAISKTLPLQQKAFSANVLFAFFDGLIPEGWLLDVAERNWKLRQRDRMGLLLACCKDCIGAVSVHETESEKI
jgi:serine/threonine-protein kinase HipA